MDCTIEISTFLEIQFWHISPRTINYNFHVIWRKWPVIIRQQPTYLATIHTVLTKPNFIFTQHAVISIQLSHMPPSNTRGTYLFWITCISGLKLLRKTSHLQVIQNSAPSIVRWRQCDIRIIWLSSISQPFDCFLAGNGIIIIDVLLEVENLHWLDQW